MSTESEFSSSDVQRLLGQVKWFNNKAGYGFITVSDGEQAGKDIFIHFSSISASESQYKYLVQGEYVEFVLDKSTTDSHEFQATQVSGVKSGKLMCETRRIATLNADGSERPRNEYRKYRVRRNEGEESTPSSSGPSSSSSGPSSSSSGPSSSSVPSSSSSGPSSSSVPSSSVPSSSVPSLSDSDFTKVERKTRVRPTGPAGPAGRGRGRPATGGRGGKKPTASASSS